MNKHRTKLILITVFLLGFVFFYWNQRYWGQRYWGQSYISGFNFKLVKNDVVFGADAKDTIKALAQIMFGADMRKHVLFSFTLAPIVQLFQKIPFVDYTRSIRLVFSLLAGLNVVGVFYLFERKNISRIVSLFFTAIYTFCFSVFVIYSIPETYQLSNLLVISYLIVLLSVVDKLDWHNSIVLAVLAGMASLYNHPLLSLVMIHLLVLLPKQKFIKWILISTTNILVSLSVFLMINYFVYGPGFWLFIQSYSNEFASLGNLLNFQRVVDVFMNFVFFAVVSPIGYLPTYLTWENSYGYLSTIWGLILIVMWVCGLLFIVYHMIRFGKKEVLNVALSVWVLVMMLFYVYFNPTEAILYSSQTIPPILLIYSSVFDVSLRSTRVKFVILAVFCILLALNNGIAFYTGVPL